MTGAVRTTCRRWIVALVAILCGIAWFASRRGHEAQQDSSAGVGDAAVADAADAADVATPPPASDPNRRPGRAFPATDASAPPDADSEARPPEAPPAADAPRVGRVLDREGRPAWMANVFLALASGDGSAEVVRTRRDGTFEFYGAMALRIMAWDAYEGVSEWIEVGADAAPLVLRLGDGGVVTGIVRSSDGAVPAPGVEVRLTASAGGTGTPFTAPLSETTTTGPDGRYEFRRAPFALDVGVRVSDVGRWAPLSGERDLGRTPRDRDEQRAAGRVHRFTRPGETWERDLVAVPQPGAQFRFEFTFPPGGDVPAEVVADWTWTQGRYPVEERTTTELDSVRPAVERFLRVDRHSVQFRARGVVAVTREFDVTGGEGPQVVAIVFAAAPRARVLARIVGRDGELPPDPGRVLIARCLPDGDSARLDVTAGVADLSAWLQELPVGSGQLVAFGVAGDGLFAHDGDLDIPDLRVALPALRERLASRPGEDVIFEVPAGPAVEVTLRVTAGGRPAEGVELDAGDEPALATAVLRTDARGEVRLRFNRPPEWGVRLEARPPWYGAWSWHPDVLSPDGARYGAGVRIVAGRRVAEMVVVPSRVSDCELTDPAGRPLPGVSIGGVDAPDGGSVETDARGRFRVATPADSTSIRARASGFEIEEVPLAPVGAVTRIVAWQKRPLIVVLSGLPPDIEAAEVTATSAEGSWSDTEGERVSPDRPEVAVEIQAPRRPLRLTAVAGTVKPRSWWTGTATASASDDRVEIRLARTEADELAVAFVRPDGSAVSGRRAVIIYAGIAMTDAAGIARVQVPRGVSSRVGFHVDGHVCEPRSGDVAGAPAEPIRVTARPSAWLRLLHRSPRDRAAVLANLRVVREDGSFVPARVDRGSHDAEGLTESFRVVIDGGAAPGRLEFLCDGVAYSVPVKPGEMGEPVVVEVE